MYGPFRGHVSPNPIILYALHKQNGPMNVDFRCPQSSCTSGTVGHVDDYGGKYAGTQRISWMFDTITFISLAP